MCLSLSPMFYPRSLAALSPHHSLPPISPFALSSLRALSTFSPDLSLLSPQERELRKSREIGRGERAERVGGKISERVKDTGGIIE